MSLPDPSLILIGASVRAAAFSALRAGLQPWCADLFGDLDLRQRCPVAVVPSDDYPQAFASLLSTAPAFPWMFTGALENHHALIHRLAADRPLWGVAVPSLIQVRTPQLLASLLREGGHECPVVCAVTALPSDSRRWLVKPFSSAAGRGIRFLDENLPAKGARYYLQEYIEGESGAALFLAEENGCRLLGVTRQLVGADWLHSEAFHYCGSVGPWLLPPESVQRLSSIGATLAGCGLRGLFGVDFVLRDGVPWPVEVNPRYTASIEVLEYATGLTALALHRRVFDPAAPAPPPPSRSECAGKAIYFAPRRLMLPADGPWMDTLRNPPALDVMPAFADIPQASQVIEAGRPVLTFFARGGDTLGCEHQLRQMAVDLDRVFATG